MTVTTATEAWAWGEEGHRAVADAACQLSLTQETRAAITKLLGNDDMAAMSVWLDEVRQAKRNQGPLVHDPEAKMFNQPHPNNAEWHFVNLPLSSATFSTDPSCSEACPLRREPSDAQVVLNHESLPGRGSATSTSLLVPSYRRKQSILAY
jgi:hypothetical protein